MLEAELQKLKRDIRQSMHAARRRMNVTGSTAWPVMKHPATLAIQSNVNAFMLSHSSLTTSYCSARPNFQLVDVATIRYTQQSCSRCFSRSRILSAISACSLGAFKGRLSAPT